MKIQLKRSNVLENGKAKEPSIQQMEFGELAVNYNTADPSLFIKDSADQIVKLRITEGAQVLISDTIPSTTENEPGTLWWNSSADSGQLFILYDDPSGGGGGDVGGPKWIEASPTTGGPDGGGAKVLVSDTAPVVDDLEEGSLWWNSSSDDLQLYVLYSDSGNKKWVEASPMPSQPNVSGYPDTDDGNGATLDERYVQTQPAGGASQDVAGDLTIGGGKITLDATNGSATFAGSLFSITPNETRIGANTGSSSQNASSVVCKSEGTVAIFHENGSTKTFFQCSENGKSTRARILYDGSAEFAGGGFSIGSTGNLEITGTTTLFATGNYPAFRAKADATVNPGTTAFESDLGTTNTATIYRSGSAYFKGNVTSDGTIGFNLEPDNPANYTTTTDSEGNETQVYNGPTLDVKERLQNLISRLDSLESDEIADDATSTLLLTTVNNLNTQMTKVNLALTAIRAAANAAGTLDQLKSDIAAATADI